MAKGSKIFRPNGSGPFQITVRKIVIFCLVLLLLYFLVYLGPDMSRGPEAISPSPENGKDVWISQFSTEEGPVPWEGGGVSKLSSYVLPKVTSEEFQECDEDKTDWVPCHDEKFNSAHKIKRNGYEFRERHCPSDEEMPKCLVPPPSGYKIPVKWPRSREEVWLSNVPHTKLADYKADQKWMEVEGDKVLFPGGGTFSKGGVEAYIEQLIPMLRKDEEHKSFTEIGIRMALDIGAGVASFGGHLLERNVVAASFAPLDVHDAQVQFALERGIPAYVAALASKRMPYPGGAFEMVHCSWCRIEWWAKDGAPLVEVDRVLRPGGYFIWTSPAAERDDETDKKWREQMNELIDRVCWKQIERDHLTVVWQKPAKDECLKGLGKDAKPPVCATKPVVEELGLLWDKTFDGCIDKYRKEVIPVAELPKWPARLSELPPRLAAMGVSKKDFEADSATWRKRVETYWEWAGFPQNAIRNVMDMNAHWGSFAAALVDKPLWVWNVVPAAPSISSDPPPNTLPGLFDRGLLAMTHNWCQSFSTYPRTYDLLHAPGILTLIKNQGCLTEGVLLEMDRILRPTGYVILSDKPSVIKKASGVLGALRWELVKSVLVKRKGDQEAILFFRKKFWLPGGNMGELPSSESDAENEEPEKKVEKEQPEEGDKVSEPEKEDGGGKGDGEGETEDGSKEEKGASDQKEGDEETATSESKGHFVPGDGVIYPDCAIEMKDWIPCHNLTYAKSRTLRSWRRERYDRHCPPPRAIPKCLVPPPVGYQVPVRWPESRTSVWLANVYHTKLSEYKADQKWMEIEGDKVIFPGGGTYGAAGADTYINTLGKILKKLGRANRRVGTGLQAAGIRVVMDVGCGVASFGGQLLERDILALSLAPPDEHEAQVQFALERGIPATLGALGWKKQPQPSLVFDMVHCSWCRINWGANNGENLVEVDRLLRPGGYFIWTSPAVTRTDEKYTRWRTQALDAARLLCWEKLITDSITIVYRKPTDSTCYEERSEGDIIPTCDRSDPATDPDTVWGSDMGRCITRMPSGLNIALDDLPSWPDRGTKVPSRLAAQDVSQEAFDADTAKWYNRVDMYWRWMKGGVDDIRNVMDMSAHWGGFAAALASKPVWVLNIIPVAGVDDSLAVIFDRGFLGHLHSWCEAVSTYPRTYDFLHADGIVGLVKELECGGGVENLLLEMDRLLRPHGYALFRGTRLDLDEVAGRSPGLRWDCTFQEDDEADGDVMLCRKQLPVETKGHRQLSTSEIFLGEGLDSGEEEEERGGSEEDEVRELVLATEALETFPVCTQRSIRLKSTFLEDWVPCHDHDFNKRNQLRVRGYARMERHCPPPDLIPECLIPPPRSYQIPVRWPLSREQVFLSNVRKTKLAEYKAKQNWMVVKDDMVTFPGGGTYGNQGAKEYIATIGKLLTNGRGDIANANVRMALDIGCGVASFGGYLLDQGVLTASFAPVDIHEAQVQFALERGIPAFVGAIAEKRLPFPASVFELVHCSWCRVDFGGNEGLLLTEVDRVMRPGGYFVWTTKALDSDVGINKRLGDAMRAVMPSLCWKEVAKRQLTIIWQKPTSGECYEQRQSAVPRMCDPGSAPEADSAWQVSIPGCIVPPPAGTLRLGEVPPWPARLHTLPARLAEIGVSQQEFSEDCAMWSERVERYLEWVGSDAGGVRNVMDMNAQFGSFAAALESKSPQPLWVMNTMPIASSQSDTLPGILDRGLLGMTHDWCEPFSTYPRTYDLVHWDHVSESLQGRCLSAKVLLEVDRILRPEGWVILRETPSMLQELAPLFTAMHWHVIKAMQLTRGEGIALCRKQFWTKESLQH